MMWHIGLVQFVSRISYVRSFDFVETVKNYDTKYLIRNILNI